jgi:FtsP/CotA-like multicopper oxidase with cupredoxin domain
MFSTGRAPGPTFMMQRGREAVVRFINHGDRANSVHLHGSYSRAPFDGWAEDTTLVGQYKDYCKFAKCRCRVASSPLSSKDIY